MLFNRRLPRAASFVVAAATAATAASGLTALPANATSSDLQITAIRLEPATINVTKAAGQVGVVMNITDNGSGLSADQANVTAHCLSGCPVSTPALSVSSPAFQAGPSGNETLTASLRVPVGTAPSAHWVVDSIVLHNFETSPSHDRTYTDADLTNAGIAQSARTFTVAATADTTPPAMPEAPSISPTSVDVSTTDKNVTLLLHLTDNSDGNQSGVDHGSITLMSGGNTKSFNFTTANNTDSDPTIGTLVKGSAFDGFYRFNEVFTALDKGTWTITNIHALDAQGQSLSLSNNVAWPTLDVTGLTDTAGPTLVDSTLLAPAQSGSSVTVNATTNDTSATLVTHLLDTNGSGGAGVGFDHGSYVFFDSVSGLSLAGDILKSNQTAPANPGVDDGTWQTIIPVPARQTPGDYQLQSLTLVDRAGNTTVLQAPGTPPPARDINVTADADNSNGPSLTSFTLSSAHVNVHNSSFSTGHTVAFVHVQDDVSGFYSGTLTFTDAANSSNQVVAFFDRSNVLPGTNVNGDFRDASYRIEINPTIAGTYNATELDLNDTSSQLDGTGITTQLNGSAIAAQAAGGPTSFVALDNGADTVAPTIVSAAIAPSTSVDASNGFQKVTVTVNATDSGGTAEATGVSFISLEFRSVNGGGSNTLNVFADGSSSGCFGGPNINDTSPCLDGIVSGDFKSGNYSMTVYVPQWAVGGQWVLDNADISDAANNDRFYSTNAFGSATDVSAIGGAHSFNVTGSADVTGPAVQSFTLDPASITSDNVNTYTANGTLHLTDDLSGVDGNVMSVNFSSPSGNQGTTFASIQPVTPADPHNATYAFTVTFPKFPESGTWVAAVHVRDLVGNRTDLFTPQLSSAGLMTGVSVSGTPDTTPPALSGITIDHTTINSTTGQQAVVSDIHVTDVGIGFGADNFDCNDVTLDVTDNNGQPANLDFCGVAFIGGNSNDAWFEASIVIPQYNASGTWTITAVHVRDQAGNTTTVPESITITVTSASDTTAPTAASVSFDKSAVDVTNSTGQVVITAHLLDDVSGVSFASLDFIKPNSAHVQVTLAKTAGTANDGTWSGTLFIPQTTGAGTWTTNTLELDDVAGNSALLTPSQVTAAGAPATINATGPVPPTASFTESTTAVQVGGTVHFDGSGSSAVNATITNYQWDFGDGHGANGAVVDHVYATAGQFTPTLTVTDSHSVQNTHAGTQISVGTVPGQPTGESATTGVNSVVVSWGAAPGTVSSYTLLVKDGTTTVQTINPATSPTTVTGLTSGKTYTLDVVANNGFGSGPAAETTAIAGGPAGVTLTSTPPGVTSSAAATFGFTASPGSSVQCALDGVAGACASASTATYSGLAQGVHSFVVTATDAAAQKATASYSWRVDSVAPSATVGSPSSTTTLAKTIGVTWSGSDPNGSGVVKYDVRYTKAASNGQFGAATAWQSGTTATSGSLAGVPGYEYCISVRAYDAAGNVSGYSAAKCTAIPLDDRSLTPSAGWTKVTGKTFYLGTAMQTAAKGKTLTRKGAIAGRAVLYVDKGRGFGSLAVLYNGKVVKTISLASTKTVTKFAIILPRVTKATVIVIKTTAAKKVQIDGLLLARI